MSQPTERSSLISQRPAGCCGGSGSGACCKNAGGATAYGASSSTGAAVALPKRGANAGSVWAVDNAGTDADRARQIEDLMAHEQPLGTKCGANHRNDGQCCKDLKGDDERHLISPEIVRDIIIGLSDGLTVPFALTAGLSSLGSSKLVVTGGLAELCAGAISMGLGGFLASQAELDHFHYLRRQTAARVQRSCAGEMEREVHAILGPLGVKEALSRLIASDLRAIEDDQYAPGAGDEGVEGNDTRKPYSRGNDEEGGPEIGETGLTAFLLKFGEGMEEVPRSRLWISALTIGLSYFIGGLIPLIPYMATSTAEQGLIASVVLTGVILFIFGGVKTYFTGATGGYGGYIWGSVSTMVVGGLAAGAAYGLVKLLGVQE
ncbi:Protein ccc1 [Cryptotrichosporon argae]